MNPKAADEHLDAQRLPLALHAAIHAEFDATIAVASPSSEDPDERVHEARKHLKRWRALIRLLPTRSAGQLARVQRIVQRVARRLGAVRDPVAQRETWYHFANKLETKAHLSTIGEQLDRHHQTQVELGLVERRLRRAEQALSAARSELTSALDGSPRTHPKQLRAALRGFARSYRKAQRAFAHARAQPNSDSLHALRRANKAHQYQLQFLEPVWREVLKAQRSEVAQLSDDLGEHHDLGVTAEWLQRALATDPEAVALGQRQLRSWQQDLEQRSLERAALVYAERPRDFERRIRRYLKSAASSPATEPASTKPVSD